VRIVAINGSHRGDKGFTHFFLDRLSRGAVAAGGEFEIVTLAKLKINRCLSCYRCQNGDPHLVCVYHERDDVAMVFQKMAGADILVYATPVYLMSMSGLLKTFLDRIYSTADIRDARLSSGLIHHHINPAISSKPFVTLVVCSNVEEETPRNVTSYFRTYARFMEARQVGVLVRNASGLFEAVKDRRPAPDFPKVAGVCVAFEQAGRELATLGRIRRATQRRASQEVVPVPLFGLLKRLRPVKMKVIEYLRQ
jgi:multimeric flavodoxin WrbA